MSAEDSAPAFTIEEHALIASWAEQIRTSDLRIEFSSGYEFVTEALLVFPSGAEEPLWMVHKTPAGAVALRLWPGVAEIVPTVSQALAAMSEAMGKGRRAGHA